MSALLAASAGAQQTELWQLQADDGATGDRFGFSCAIEGNLALIGSLLDDDQGDRSGSAYLFDVTTGQQVAKVLPDEGVAGAVFGSAAAMDGGLAVIGAYREAVNGLDDAGSAYLFDVSDPGNPTQLYRFQPDAPFERALFGGAVDIDGGRVIIGAHGDGPRDGYAYIFDAATGLQTLTLAPENDPEAWESFGRTVAIEGNLALVAATGDAGGSVFLFDATTGQQLGKLRSDDIRSGDYFGSAIAIDGDRLLVGAAFDDDNGTDSGSAYVFDVPTRQQVAKLVPDDGETYGLFGLSVALHGGIAVVGAPEVGGEAYLGAAYLFDATTGQQLTALAPARGKGYARRFGESVAIDGAYAVVGETGNFNTEPGWAYVYDSGAGCPPDLNGDESVDTLDFLAFLGLWAAGDTGADWDNNGAVNTQDFLAFLNDWAAGC